MMPMPDELKVLVVLCAIGALWLGWCVRRDWIGPNGRPDPWRAVEDVLSLFLMLAMLITAGIQVTVRYTFSDHVDLPWTEEFGRLMMIWAAFWGAAALQRADDHIAMTVVYDVLPASWKVPTRLIGDVATVLVLVPVVWLGWQNAEALEIMSSISLGLPIAIFAYPVPIGGGLMIAHTVAVMIRRFRGVPTHAPAAVPL